MTQAIGILELTSIARGMELGDVMLKSANVQLLLCRTLCPGKFLLMLGGDVGAVQQAIAAGTARAGGDAGGQPGAGQHSPPAYYRRSAVSTWSGSGRRRGSSKPGAWRRASAPPTTR